MIRSIYGKTPHIHPTAFISEACYIVGDVVIGEGASVWPGAVIRGDYGRITIGRGTVVQDNAVIHTDDFLDIGDGVVITHGAVVHCRRIGDHVFVGTNATLLEGAVIGDGCLIAAQALVLAGSVVPPHSLVVGVPGRVKELPEEHRGLAQRAAAAYWKNAQAFRAAGLGEVGGQQAAKNS